MSIGIYSASLALTASNGLAFCFPVWHNNLGLTYLSESSPIYLKALPNNEEHFEKPSYITTITNLKPVYNTKEVANFRTFVRDKNKRLNVFTSLNTDPEPNIIENSFFKITRLIDGLEFIPYGSSSMYFTLMSYDTKGNYIENFDMSLLEPRLYLWNKICLF